jgi:hypothetical protein
MTPVRRRVVRFAWVAAAALLLAELLELAVWPLPFGSLYLFAFLAPIAVPVIGAVLVTRGDERGIAVLVTGALIALPLFSFDVIQLVRWSEPVTLFEVVLATLRLTHTAAMIASGVLAWQQRDRSHWVFGPVRSRGYVVVALLTFAAGQAWPSRVMLPPASLADVPFLLQLVTFATVLVAAALLPRALAAAVLLAAVVPVLATTLFDLGQMLSFGAVLGDISGLIDLLGRAVLLGIGVHWLRAEPVRPPRVSASGPA